MEARMPTPGVGPTDNLWFLAKRGSGNVNLAQCAGLLDEICHCLRIKSVPVGQEVAMLREVLVETARVARSSALNVAPFASGLKKRDENQAAAAAELLSIKYPDEEFAVLLRIHRLTREEWFALETNKEHAGPVRKRQLRARLWLGVLDDKNYCHKMVQNNEDEYLDTFLGAVRDRLHDEAFRPLMLRYAALAVDQQSSIEVSVSGAHPTSLMDAADQVYAQRSDWPFRLVRSRPGDPFDWRSVLDGSPLTPVYARDAIIARRVEIGGIERSQSQFASWLTREVGRTVFLYGDVGGGTTSYIAKVAVDTEESHVFLRHRSGPINFDVLEDFRHQLMELVASSGLAPELTVIVLISFPLYGDEQLEQHVTKCLNDRLYEDSRLVVMMEGRRGDLDRIASRVSKGDRASLCPVNEPEARKWASMIARANDGLSEEGMTRAEINAKYPNLLKFLSMSDSERVQILSPGDDSPTLVCLLRAVYGRDMWLKVNQEFLQLESPIDKIAYMHVCLASAAGLSMPEYMLESLAQGANLDERANHDPWVRRDEDGHHIARHPVIAQVVLEANGTDRFMRSLIQEYLDRERYGTGFLDIVRRFTLALGDLAPIGTEKERDNFRNALLKNVRRAIRSAEGIEGRIRGLAAGDYWRLQEWIDFFVRVIPDNPGPENAELLDIQSVLLEEASQALNCPNIERIAYYRLLCAIRRKRANGPLNLDDLLTYVRDVSEFMRAEWCNAAFFNDLYFRSFEAWKLLPKGQLEEDDVLDGVFIVEKLFAAFQNLWKVDHNNVHLSDVAHSYSRLVTGGIHAVLPGHARDLIAYSWQESVDIGAPNPETAALYVEELYDWAEKLRGEDRRDALEEAAAVLRSATRANPAYAEVLYQIAAVRALGKIEVVSDLADRIVRARQGKVTPLSSAFLAHAAALLEADKLKRASLLRDAMDGYRTHTDEEKRKVHRVGWAWGHAWKDLKETGATDWTEYRAQAEYAERTIRQAD